MTRVLLIEDETVVIEGIKQRLDELADGQQLIHVDSAHNFPRAKDYLEKYEYDLIISDLHMPGFGLGAEINQIDGTVLNGWIFLKIIFSRWTVNTTKNALILSILKYIRTPPTVASVGGVLLGGKGVMKRSRRHRGPSFKVPNRLILDTSLSFSARRMGAVLYSRRNRLGACTRSLANLAKLAHCSIPTARKALVELEEAGFISRTRNYKYDEGLARLVYTQFTYRCDLSFQGGFTLIPWSLFGRSLKRGAFLVCLYLYYQTGNKNVAFPSLSYACRMLWMGKSTLCTALHELEDAGLVYIRHCVKRDRAYSNNSYFFLCRTEENHKTSCVDRACDSVTTFQPFCTVVEGGDCPGPFPCLYYRPGGEEVQVISGLRGSPKICKLLIRLI